MAVIYGGTQENENTPDYWAGYSPNPDDEGRLQSKLKELVGAAPLLKDLGSFPGRGDDELVFDLGGNVAEWAVNENGMGVTLGGSADRLADTMAGANGAAPSYVGFRVAK